MKVTNQIWNVMNNRMEWLEEWLKLRQYNIDGKETQFMYVYYCTLRNFMDEKYARIKAENINQRLVHPLSEQELEEIYNKVGNGFIQFFKNEDIINRLGVIPAEAESLQIGINMKKRKESAERSKERECRNHKIRALYYKGCSEKRLCDMFHLSLRQIQYIVEPLKPIIKERAEVYGCAADRQQASIVFEVAADMVRLCPALNKRVKILASQKRIIYQPTNSFYQVLSAEAYSKHGFNIHGVVFDELHTQPNRKLLDLLSIGLINDMYAESRNDDCKYAQLATQEDFDRF